MINDTVDTPEGHPNSSLRAAVEGIADDYMTSENHHPGYVLIPTAKFEAIRAALKDSTASRCATLRSIETAPKDRGSLILFDPAFPHDEGFAIGSWFPGSPAKPIGSLFPGSPAGAPQESGWIFPDYQTGESYVGSPTHWAEMPEKSDLLLAVDITTPVSNAEPLFWYRPAGHDGGYEGPHHNDSNLGKQLRDALPGQWKPLFAVPSPSSNVSCSSWCYLNGLGAPVPNCP